MSRALPGLDSFATSIARYEAGMRERLGDTVVEKQLKAKHKLMRADAFLFLRATCWRWAEAAPSLCPALMDAPAAPSVGDAHAGNFGLWRDAGARLVWGINDYDEAARLPWCLDLVRLCASLVLAIPRPDARAIAEAALDGYARGLAVPSAQVLERDRLWLRDAFAARDAKRAAFWDELASARPARTVPDPYRDALVAALPSPDLEPQIAARAAGAGSLGRPRFVAYCDYRGGPLAVEVKAALPSCWARGREAGLAGRMATGRYRSADPRLHYRKAFVLRRLAPNSRKLDFDEIGKALRSRLIAAMAAELAAVQGEDDRVRAAIAADMGSRKRGWLRAAAATVAGWTADEQDRYRRKKSQA